MMEAFKKVFPAVMVILGMVLLIGSDPTFARKHQTVVMGTVRSVYGEPLAGLTVYLKTIAKTSKTYVGTTNRYGAFTFRGLSAGSYEVLIHHNEGKIASCKIWVEHNAVHRITFYIFNKKRESGNQSNTPAGERNP